MREILISIKPKWVELIASGRKTVELRKSFPNYAGNVWVYSCSPVKKIAGRMVVRDIARMAPDDLWNALGGVSCVTKEQYDSYYAGRSVAVGLVIEAWQPLRESVPLSRIGLRLPPQSWRWIDAPLALEKEILNG